MEVEGAAVRLLEKPHGSLHDQVGKVAPVQEDFVVVLPEVVERWLPRLRVEEPVRVVVDEASQVPEKLIEAEVPRAAPRPRSQVPLAEEARPVAMRTQRRGEGDSVRGDTDAALVRRMVRAPVVDP